MSDNEIKFIDDLIQTISNAVADESVTNEMVGRVFDALNTRSKKALVDLTELGNRITSLAANVDTAMTTLQDDVDVQIASLATSLIPRIDYSGLDLLGKENMTDLRDLVKGGPMVYSITMNGNRAGSLAVISTSDGCVLTEVLLTHCSGLLDGLKIFDAHNDRFIWIYYRNCPLTATGASNTDIKRGVWGPWTLYEQHLLDDIETVRADVKTLKEELTQLREALAASDANFAALRMEWLEDAGSGGWSATLPSRIEKEIELRLSVAVNGAMQSDGVSDWRVTRRAGDTAADKAWNDRHPLTASDDGYLYIRLSPEDILDSTGTRFEFTALYTRTRNGVSYSQTVEGTLRLEMGGLVFYIDRGVWQVGTKYYNNQLNTEGRLETSDAWRYGNKWRSETTHTATADNGPGFGNPMWTFLEGDDQFHVDFAEPVSVVDLNNIELPLTLTARYHGEDVLRFIADSDVVWSRYSETEAGEPRVELDAEWNAANSGRGKAPVFRESDFQSTGSEGLGRISFTAVVTLRDPVSSAKVRAAKTFSV